MADLPHEQRLRLTVLHRTKQFRLYASPQSTLRELGEELQSLTGIAPHTMRLLIPKHNRRTLPSALLPFSDEHAAIDLEASGITENLVIRMMGALPEELKEVSKQSGQKYEATIIGFSEEERRAKQRLAAGSAAGRKLPQGSYIFCDFQTLHLPGIKLDPSPDRALEIMHKLASDPGIVSIMNKHQWRVGVMTEMAPIGYVGISPKCVLGFNKNHGEEISLRLRTDDLKGFRNYESIKKTLLHELAHMVYSEHDADFFALNKQLNEESTALDWTKSKGHTWGGLKHYEEEESIDARGVQSDNAKHGYRVGGSAETLKLSARSAAAAATLRRLGDKSAGLSEDQKEEVKEAFAIAERNQLHSEPNPEDLLVDTIRNQEPEIVASMYKNDFEKFVKTGCEHDFGENEVGLDGVLGARDQLNLNDSTVKNPGLDGVLGTRDEFTLDGVTHNSNSYQDMEMGHELGAEPDPDDIEDSRAVRAEPDCDDKLEGRSVSVDPNSTEEMVKDEPDPDDSGMEVIQELVVDPNTNEEIKKDEPDPDDSGMEVLQELVVDPNPNEEIIKDEPDPDDSGMEVIQELAVHHNPNEETMKVEPDPDDSGMEVIQELVVDHNPNEETIKDEPDPDDSGLQVIQAPVEIFCMRLGQAIAKLKEEATPAEAATAIQTLFVILRNVMEHPHEAKFKRLRKANPVFKNRVAKFRGALEVLHTVGFSQEPREGLGEDCLILERDDPGLLWLARSSLETSMA